MGAAVVVVKPGKKGADGQKTKSRCYGETALVNDDNWNGMCKVEITSGPHAGQIKSYQAYHLRPEGHTINSEQETGGLRTATVMSNSFAELQVLKKVSSSTHSKPIASKQRSSQRKRCHTAPARPDSFHVSVTYTSTSVIRNNGLSTKPLYNSNGRPTGIDSSN